MQQHVLSCCGSKVAIRDVMRLPHLHQQPRHQLMPSACWALWHMVASSAAQLLYLGLECLQRRLLYMLWCTYHLVWLWQHTKRPRHLTYILQ